MKNLRNDVIVLENEIKETLVAEDKQEIKFNPKKIETSKILLTVVLTVCFALAIVIIVGWFMGLIDAPAMLGIVVSPAATVITTYTIKSKRENEIKLKAIYGKLYVPESSQNQYGYGGFGGYNNYGFDSSDPNINGVG